MRIVARENLDVTKWDALVERHSAATFFSYSWYLDAVAENWSVLVNDEYSAGMALPFSKRLGVKKLYIPIFGRYVTPMGEISEQDLDLVKKEFPVREISTNLLLFSDNVQRVHQVIAPEEERNLSTQGKRSLVKAEKSGITLATGEDCEATMKAIRSEIQGKFKGVDKDAVHRLEKLFENARERGLLQVIEVRLGEETGGIACLKDSKRLLYVKGSCPGQLKKAGGMYFALNEAIEMARRENLLFDFGGSNVEGVRRFNLNLGGKDLPYYYHENQGGHSLYKLARNLKNRVR